MKDDCLVKHLIKEENGIFAKIATYFLRDYYTNICSLKFTRKAINQGDGKTKKVPCKLHFSAEDSFINILKQQLPRTL